MPTTVTHPFVNAKADGADATLVRPSNWNAEHTVTVPAFDPITLTNSAAGSTAVGDVLAVSSQTAVLGDTVSSLQKYVVAAAIIANAATGEFAYSGQVSAASNGAIAAMQYVRKSATARTIEDAGSAVGAAVNIPDGVIGFALAAASGGFCTIFLYDGTYSAGGAAAHIAASAAVHGLGASVNVLGNRTEAGAFIQRGTAATNFTTGAGAITLYSATTTFSFAVAFSATPQCFATATSTDSSGAIAGIANPSTTGARVNLLADNASANYGTLLFMAVGV